MRNNLIVFATYWNEIDWIQPSLEQLDRLQPIEAIICDGCFDPSIPSRSTDGTRAVIELYVSRRPWARMISAVRVSRARAVARLLRGHDKARWWNRFTPARAKTALLAARCHEYRLNQALTFQRMISLSQAWKVGRWFMSYDCDQFYSDDMLDAFKLVNRETPYGVLFGRELTFFNGFEHYTDQHERRQYNNMPHRIYPGTTVIPTRGLILENWSRPSISWRIRSEFYWRKVPALEVGHYFHYKFKFDKERVAQGYVLGDRRPPRDDRYERRPFRGDHPLVVEKWLTGLGANLRRAVETSG